MTKPRGFTIFFAVLVGSLSLGIGLAIYDLLVRELQLSQTATQSQYAIYAADTGAECALYWDSHYNGTSSAFATSTASNEPTSGIVCNGQDIAAVASGGGTWPQTQDSTSATTIFQVLLVAGDTKSPCAIVTVAKSAANAGEPSDTTITSNGLNVCSSTAGVQLQRTLQVTY